jgi:hypothetical protein
MRNTGSPPGISLLRVVHALSRENVMGGGEVLFISLFPLQSL